MLLEHRLQVLIDSQRRDRLNELARERGVSVGTIVREALDRSLADPASRRKEAGLRILAAPPMPVPEIEDLVAELDELRGRRG